MRKIIKRLIQRIRNKNTYIENPKMYDNLKESIFKKSDRKKNSVVFNGVEYILPTDKR